MCIRDSGPEVPRGAGPSLVRRPAVGWFWLVVLHAPGGIRWHELSELAQRRDCVLLPDVVVPVPDHGLVLPAAHSHQLTGGETQGVDAVPGKPVTTGMPGKHELGCLLYTSP